MKRTLAMVLAALMILSLGSAALAEEKVAITMWTYPIGAWKDAETVNGFIAAFN